MLKELEEFKLQVELLTKMVQLLDQPAPNISAYDVVEFMFRLVLIRMHEVKLASFESQYLQDSVDYAHTDKGNSSRTTIAITREA